MMKDGILVNAKGITLYNFDKDVAGSGKSACNGDCIVKWPPLLAADTDMASGDFTLIARDDGRKQWAYKGKPLYTWPEDSEPGDKYGDNFKQVWHVIK
jgi:predicted lipoprotein with Yx(FWY)xxD motif